jgi:intraflagellar transport protein 74
MTSGPGRMVQDASYFASLLRQKINEISTEITRMKNEVDKATKDATVLGQYERKYDTLIKEVRSLEGDLADYNLAMDKSRTSMVSSN